jgi:hypothetical protein
MARFIRALYLEDAQLDSGNRLVLQHPHDHATILRLAFGGLIIANLMGL